MEFSNRRLFSKEYVAQVPRQSGVYVIYDLAGPVYIGRSAVDIQQRLISHFNMNGNRNIAYARRIGAGSTLTFTFCCMPVGVQRDVEAVLIRHLGATSFANLRNEACLEDWPIEWSRLAMRAAEFRR